MSKPNVLILSDKEDITSLDSRRQSKHWNVYWKTIDYKRWPESAGDIRDLMTKHDIEVVMYSRNDQVAHRDGIGSITRTLRTGYSSFSGIDKKDRIDQMSACFDDFMECGRQFDTSLESEKQPSQGDGGGTFTLIFDTEQLGGAKYGLPRLLNLLNRYGISATFFITNLVIKVYPDVLKVVKEQGHEVGIHGIQHEYFADLGREEQTNLLRRITEDFNIGIDGANFAGRMDETTIQALIDNGLKYFVYPLRDNYRFLSYRKIATIPSLLRLPEGDIWALPISLETYNSPWFSIKNMIDSAINNSRKCGFPHITVLCHCFRDGNAQHIRVTEKLASYLCEKNLRPVVLSELVNKLNNHRSNILETGELKRFIQPDRGGIHPPRNLRDFLSMVPENLVMLYRLFRSNRGTF